MCVEDLFLQIRSHIYVLRLIPVYILCSYMCVFQRPTQRQGTTKIIANDRGHLNKGIPRDSSSPWGSFVGTWQAEIKPPMLMTKTKLVNPRNIIKSPPQTAIAKESKPVSPQDKKKPSSPAASKVEAPAIDSKRSGSPAKPTSSRSPNPPSLTASNVKETATDSSRSGSPAKPLSSKSTKPSSPALSKVEEATVKSNKIESPTKPMSPTYKSVATSPVSVTNDNNPADQQQAITPVKSSTPHGTVVSGDNATMVTVQTDNKPPSKPVATPDASTKPAATASIATPPNDAVVTTPQ